MQTFILKQYIDFNFLLENKESFEIPVLANMVQDYFKEADKARIKIEKLDFKINLIIISIFILFFFHILETLLYHLETSLAHCNLH